MIKPGMTGTHDGKKFTILRHAESGEVYKGHVLHNETRTKVWANFDGKEELFAFPVVMSVAQWKELFDQPPTP